ncbi:MAG: hypothetical protein AB1757_22905 [Acidobacteriota bacterium]
MKKQQTHFVCGQQSGLPHIHSQIVIGSNSLLPVERNATQFY